jgi:flagellar hook-basal body complex protein FliE
VSQLANAGELKKGATNLAKTLGQSATSLTDTGAVFDTQKAAAEAILRGSDTAVEQEVAGKIAKASQSAATARAAVEKTIEALETYANAR